MTPEQAMAAAGRQVAFASLSSADPAANRKS
jgi:hypothetical protein